VTENENRDPFPCPECGAVNVWNATICRICNAPISKEIAADKVVAKEFSTPDGEGEAVLDGFDAPENELPAATSQDTPQPDVMSLRRRWNVFWIVLGIAIHVAGVHLGLFAILKFLVEPDAELKEALEEKLAAAKSDIKEGAPTLVTLSEPLESKINTIRWTLIFLLVIIPLLIGLSAGFFTGTILDGAAAMGLSAVLIPLLNGAAEFAIVWGPANALVGALGAYLGVRLARLIHRSVSMPPSP
jgi:hypothetical protein